MHEKKIGAIILAAGLSSRMGEFKPLATIGAKTIIGHAVTLFLTAGIDNIVVVTGHESESLQQELDQYSCRVVFNRSYTDGMFSSIQLGVRELPPDVSGFFLLPVDIPLVQPNTIDKLIKAMIHDSSLMVLYPEYGARRGHPPLIRVELVPAIMSYSGHGGLRALLKRYSQHSSNITVDDPYILLDADTQNDLKLLRKHHQRT